MLQHEFKDTHSLQKQDKKTELDASSFSHNHLPSRQRAGGGGAGSPMDTGEALSMSVSNCSGIEESDIAQSA